MAGVARDEARLLSDENQLTIFRMQDAGVQSSKMISTGCRGQDVIGRTDPTQGACGRMNSNRHVIFYMSLTFQLLKLMIEKLSRGSQLSYSCTSARDLQYGCWSSLAGVGKTVLTSLRVHCHRRPGDARFPNKTRLAPHLPPKEASRSSKPPFDASLPGNSRRNVLRP
ncbi:hypothetical protein VTK26DRAFT_3261 [Humicola hyalothermophila]